MRRITMVLPLLLCCCTTGLQRSGGGQFRPVAGLATVLATFDTEMAVSSIWVDRYANVYCIDRAKVRLVSYRWLAGQSGEPAVFRFELPLQDPGSFLVPGYNDGFCLADNLDRQLVFYSFQGLRTGAVPIPGHVANAAAIDAAGDIYVLDGGNRSVLVYDQRGVLLRQFMLVRDRSNDAFIPASMTVTQSAQMVAIADPATGVVQYYSGLGRYEGSFGLQAVSLAFDPSDRLWSVESTGRISASARRPTGWQTLWQDVLPSDGSGVVAAGLGDIVVIARGGKLIGCR